MGRVVDSLSFTLGLDVIDSTFITFIAMVVSAITVSAVLVRHAKSMSWLQRVGLVALGVYFPFVLGLTLGGIPTDVDSRDPSEWRQWANLVPFGTIGPQLAAGLESGLRQVAGNLLLLGPLGFLLPNVWERFRDFGSALLAWFVVALGIEISQVVISLAIGVPYRAFDVDDLILNTAGAVIGWIVWRQLTGQRTRTGGP